ncbi:MAG TPA: type II toxin-antitoxin system PrlF family antitoxin [Chloroflexota bacterium]|nr:type II toxin-antitoxin system PrlF family antitoxin [Chloroflexota bacterium]
MREYQSTMTTKGQVTIPAEVRRLLGFKPHDKVAFVVDDGQVRLERALGVIERTAGIFKGALPPMTDDEEDEMIEQAIVEDVMERYNRWR